MPGSPARQKEASVVGGMPHADVAKGVNDAQIGEDAIGNHEIFDGARDVAHGIPAREAATVVRPRRAGNFAVAGLVVTPKNGGPKVVAREWWFMSANQVKVGIVGLGRWAKVLTGPPGRPMR